MYRFVPRKNEVHPPVRVFENVSAELNHYIQLGKYASTDNIGTLKAIMDRIPAIAAQNAFETRSKSRLALSTMDALSKHPLTICVDILLQNY